MPVAIFEDRNWQMSRGERAAVEGVLAQLRPELAIEIGSMEGACLLRIAEHSGEAHSFDLDPPSLEMPGNVTLHTGDSHALLPQFLAELAEQERNVDFVMVDGDHTPEGVRQDIEDLLNSPALAQSVILIHDTANERVRSGIDAVHFAAWPKVALVELDWIPGHVFAERDLRNELWYGLGLVLVDAARLAYTEGPVFQQRYYPGAQMLAKARDQVVAGEHYPAGRDDPATELHGLRARVGELALQVRTAQVREARLEGELRDVRERHERAERTVRDIMGSPSWKVTEPLRAAKRRVARRGTKD